MCDVPLYCVSATYSGCLELIEFLLKGPLTCRPLNFIQYKLTWNQKNSPWRHCWYIFPVFISCFWWMCLPVQRSLPLPPGPCPFFSFRHFLPFLLLITPGAWAESPCSPLLSALTPNNQTQSLTEQSGQWGGGHRAEGRVLRFLFACLKQMKLAGPLVYIRGQLVTDNALIWREIDPGHRILDEIS